VFEQLLDASPLTRPMWLLWLLSAGLIGLDGFDFFIIGVALPFIQQAFGIGAAMTGAIAAAAIVGSLVGSLTLGAITDRVGRQRMLVIDIAIFVIASIATILAWDAQSLILSRFLLGIAIGADYPISVAYITENVPTRVRGRMVIGAFTFQAVGALLGAVTGVAVIHLFQTVYPDATMPLIQTAWRWMLAVGLGFAIAIALLRSQFLLESPRYYLAKGDYTAASEAASELLNQPIELIPPSLLSTSSSPPPSLFSRQYLKPTLLASLPWFLQDIATYGIGIFTPVILGFLVFATEPDFVTRTLVAAEGSAFVDLFLIAGFLGAVLLVDRVGRIPLQIIGFLGMAVGLFLLAIADSPSSQLNPPQNPNPMLVFAGFILFNLLMNLGPNATTFLLSGEVFPTVIRATGAGFAAAFAKAGAIIGTFGLPILEQQWGVFFLLIALSLVCVLAALMTYCLRIETSGRSLTTMENLQ
jgi:MFS family permease